MQKRSFNYEVKGKRILIKYSYNFFSIKTQTFISAKQLSACYTVFCQNYRFFKKK